MSKKNKKAISSIEDLKPLQLQIKNRNPNWKFRVLSIHPVGQSSHTLFYEPGEQGNEFPQKELNFYPNGKPKRETDLALLVGEQINETQWKTTTVAHGASVEFYESGNLFKVMTFDKGKAQGEMRLFHPNGSVACVCTFVDGKRVGPAWTFHENGAVAEEATFNDDLLSGELTKFYPSGKVKETQTFEAGEAQGKVMRFDELGEVIEELMESQEKPALAAAKE